MLVTALRTFASKLKKYWLVLFEDNLLIPRTKGHKSKVMDKS